jgi:hypothetical protein
MSEDEGFLGRWSRRKQEQKAAPVAADTAKPAPLPADAAKDKTTTLPKEAEPIDLASLPPIDSLGADSDYTVFLRPGVPQSMQIAALRRLWLTDPSVRDYEALVDYAWDFNAPGYGQLLPTDDVEKLARAVFGEVEKRQDASEDKTAERTDAPVPDNPATPPDNVRRSGAGGAPAAAPEPVIAEQVRDEPAVAPPTPSPARRRHGAALPRGDEDDKAG